MTSRIEHTGIRSPGKGPLRTFVLLHCIERHRQGGGGPLIIIIIIIIITIKIVIVTITIIITYYRYTYIYIYIYIIYIYIIIYNIIPYAPPEGRLQGPAWLALDSGRALATGSLHAKKCSQSGHVSVPSRVKSWNSLSSCRLASGASLPPSRLIGRAASSSHCTTPRAHRRGMRAFVGFHHFLSQPGVSTCDLLGIRPCHHQEQHRQPLTKHQEQQKATFTRMGLIPKRACFSQNMVVELWKACECQRLSPSRATCP